MHKIIYAVAAGAAAIVARLRLLARQSERTKWLQALHERQFEKQLNRDTILRVISYNILADGPRYALNTNSRYCVSRTYIQPKVRFPKIIEELKYYDADVMALQETQDHLLQQFFRPSFQANFTEIVNPRYSIKEASSGPTRDPMLKSTETTYISDKSNTLLASTITPFWSLANEYISQWKLDSISENEPLIKLLRYRYDGVSLALIRHNATNRIVCVTNTHIYWNPQHPEVKALQVFFMLEAAARFCRAQGYRLYGDSTADISLPQASLVCTGDLNSHAFKTIRDEYDVATAAEWDDKTNLQRHSGGYVLLSTGSLRQKHHEHPERRNYCNIPDLISPIGALKSIHVAVNGKEPPITTKALGFKPGGFFEGVLDYIFVSQDLTVAQVLPMPYKTISTEHGDKADDAFRACPNDIWPSDHLAVGCDIQLG